MTGLACASCLCASLTSAETILPAGYTHEQLQVAIDTAESRGTLLYRHDRAASVATDVVTKFRGFRNDKRLAGWITEAKDDDAILVTFVGGPEGEAPRALYRATVDKDGEIAGNPVRLKVPQTLTEFEAAAAAARRFALASRFEACAERYDAVILPTESGADRTWTVFLLPGTTKRNVVSMGGTHRVEIDWYSERLLSTRNFTPACQELPYDTTLAALYVTHPLDPTPTEAHVYWNLSVGLPLIVNTTKDDLLWAIEKGEIRQMAR